MNRSLVIPEVTPENAVAVANQLKKAIQKIDDLETALKALEVGATKEEYERRIKASTTTVNTWVYAKLWLMTR